MQIACPSCKKTFEVDASLIPSKGRLLQCGYCNEEWFYKKNEFETKDLSSKPSPLIEISKDTDLPADTEMIIKQAEEEIKKPNERKIHQSVTSTEEIKKPNERKTHQAVTSTEEIKKPNERKIHQSVTSVEKINQNQNVIGKIFSYTIIGIISFIALIIVLDTFKSPLKEIFPKLEYFLLSLYETLKDIELFIIDLIK